MLSLQPQDVQRTWSNLMPPLPVLHPYHNYNAHDFSTAPYDETLYSSEITPSATPELEPALELFSPYFTFDIRSPTSSPRPQHASPCSPKTKATTTNASRRSSVQPPHPFAAGSPLVTASAPPPPSPPPPSPAASIAVPERRHSSASVNQALEIARESREGAADPKVQQILESALERTWARVEAMRGDYLMSQCEFAVFNFFQNRFVGCDLAVQARRRYWEGTAGR